MIVKRYIYGVWEGKWTDVFEFHIWSWCCMENKNDHL